MRYDKFNRKVKALQEQNEVLQDENIQLKEQNYTITSVLKNTLHEVRHFSAQLSRFSERLSRDLEGTTEEEHGQQALSIFYLSGMIAARLAYTDIELNPSAIENQTPVRSGVYKKFDKAKRLLSEEARSKHLNIQFNGESRSETDSVPVFDLLPFVLLDNAIKYSPENNTIKVFFEDDNQNLSVSIQSLGPILTDSEVERVFDAGFRGESVALLPGEGRGLNLAKEICRMHGITINIDAGSHPEFELSGIGYATFVVTLKQKLY